MDLLRRQEIRQLAARNYARDKASFKSLLIGSIRPPETAEEHNEYERAWVQCLKRDRSPPEFNRATDGLDRDYRHGAIGRLDERPGPHPGFNAYARIRG